MNKQFLAERDGDILTSENGFVYAWAKGSATGNCICSVSFLKANRDRFIWAGWIFEPSRRSSPDGASEPSNESKPRDTSEPLDKSNPNSLSESH